jgi:uncharacterized BrkB/YihY/UPF0761 family membrane protein
LRRKEIISVGIVVAAVAGLLGVSAMADAVKSMEVPKKIRNRREII